MANRINWTQEDITKRFYVDFDNPYKMDTEEGEVWLYPVMFKFTMRPIKPQIIKNRYGSKKPYVIYYFARHSIPASRLYYIYAYGMKHYNNDIDHINNDSLDNRLGNLQELSHKENILKRYVDDPFLREREKMYCRYAAECKYKSCLDAKKDV